MRASFWQLFQSGVGRGPSRLVGSLRQRVNQDMGVVLGGHAVRLTLGIISSAVLARALGPEMLRMFAVVAAAQTVAGTVADFGLQRSAVRHIVGAAAHEPSQMLRMGSAYATLKVTGALIVTVLIMLWATPISHWFKLPPETGPVMIWLAAWGLMVAAVGAIMTTILQSLRRFHTLVTLQTINIILTVVMMVFLWWQGELTVISALGVGLVTAVITAVLAYIRLPASWRTAVHTPLSWRSPESRQLRSFSKWMWVSAMMTILTIQLDLLLANRFLTAHLVGIYALARSLTMKAAILNQTVHVVVLPDVSALPDASAYRHYAWRTFRRGLLLSAGLLLLTPLIGYLIPVIYGAAFAGATPVFYGLMVVVVLDLLFSPLYLLVLPMNTPQVIAFSDTFQVGILLVLGVWLLPLWGIAGIITAQVVAKVLGVMFVGSVLLFHLRHSR